MRKDRIQFGLMLNGPGSHMNAWKNLGVPADASVHLAHHVQLAKQAETAGFAFLFVADGLYIHQASSPHFLNRFEPMTLLSALAMTTSNIGLVGTVSTSYSEPFTVARQFASLDKLSGGRAGWNVVTSPLEGSAKNFNKGTHPAHAIRYEKAQEHVEVVQGLWDSWEDDAFIRNRDHGKFFDEAKMHRLDYDGTFFQVQGPLNIDRSEQGQPVIFQAGASATGREFAAANADVVFTNVASLEEAQAFYADVKAQAKALGRKEDDKLIFPGLQPIMGETIEEAEAAYRTLQQLVQIDEALAYLGRYFDHYDFSTHDLDAAFPDIGEIGANSFRSVTDRIKREAAEQNSTLREVALAVTTPKTPFFGTYEQVATTISTWFQERAADGFILSMPVLDHSFADFNVHVLPKLEAAGLYDGTYAAKTLRGNLQLDIKSNRYTGKKFYP